MKVSVIENDKYIGTVESNTNLDKWDGHNYCRGLGTHLGITRLKNKKFVLIHTTQWEGGKDYAEVITDEQAVQEILEARAFSLFDKWPDIKPEELEEEI